MRVLTVRNPWGSLIIDGAETNDGGHDVKDIENRTSNIAGSYRGLLAIHVAQAWAEGWQAHWPSHASRTTLDAVALDAQRGHIIGVVDLTDAHVADYLPAPEPGTYRPCSAWAQYPADPPAPMHHLVLSNPQRLPRPIPWRGGLGLRRAPADLVAAITGQLAEVA